MRFTISCTLSFAIAALAAQVDVDVGEDGLAFSPSAIKCNSGDTVRFNFYPGGHSVVSSDFNNPCVPNNMIVSGTINSDNGQSDTHWVIDCPGDATYLFCSQFGHCKGGMVAAINAPGTGNTLAAYKAAAAKAADNKGPVTGPTVGGQIVKGNGGGGGNGGGNGGSQSTSEEPALAPPPATSEPPPPPASSAPPPEETTEAPPPPMSSEEAAPPPEASSEAPPPPAVSCPAYDYSCVPTMMTTEAPSATPVMSSGEAAPVPASTMISLVYTPPANPSAPAAGTGGAAASTAAGASANPSATTPPAATGNDASSSFASFGAVVLVALVNAIFMA